MAIAIEGTRFDPPGHAGYRLRATIRDLLRSSMAIAIEGTRFEPPGHNGYRRRATIRDLLRSSTATAVVGTRSIRPVTPAIARVLRSEGDS